MAKNEFEERLFGRYIDEIHTLSKYETVLSKYENRSSTNIYDNDYKAGAKGNYDNYGKYNNSSGNYDSLGDTFPGKTEEIGIQVYIILLTFHIIVTSIITYIYKLGPSWFLPILIVSPFVSLLILICIKNIYEVLLYIRNIPKEYSDIKKVGSQIDDLKNALLQTMNEKNINQNELIKQNNGGDAISFISSDIKPKQDIQYSNEDIIHWQHLINIHTQIIRELEIQKAKGGNEFHYSKKIELEERIQYVAELTERIGKASGK
jgi:hypothetical protein